MTLTWQTSVREILSKCPLPHAPCSDKPDILEDLNWLASEIEIDDGVQNQALPDGLVDLELD